MKYTCYANTFSERGTVTHWQGPSFKICVLNASDYSYNLSMARYRRTRRSKRSVRRSRRRPRRSFSRRRGVRRRFTQSRSNMRAVRNLGYLLPARIRMKTKYSVDVESYAPGAPIYVYERVLNGSGLYDPDPSLGGNSALMFAELMNLYQKYYVSGSSMRVEVYPGATGAYTNKGSIYMKCADTSSGLVSGGLDLQSLREQPGIYNRSWSYYTEQKNNVFYSGYCSHRSINQAWNKGDEAYWGDETSNPIQNVYWHIIFATADESSQLTLCARYDIIYYVEFAQVSDFVV